MYMHIYIHRHLITKKYASVKTKVYPFTSLLTLPSPKTFFYDFPYIVPREAMF